MGRSRNAGSIQSGFHGNKHLPLNRNHCTLFGNVCQGEYCATIDFFNRKAAKTRRVRSERWQLAGRLRLQDSWPGIGDGVAGNRKPSKRTDQWFGKKSETLRTSGQPRPYGGDERWDDSFWAPVNRVRKLQVLFVFEVLPGRRDMRNVKLRVRDWGLRASVERGGLRMPRRVSERSMACDGTGKFPNGRKVAVSWFWHRVRRLLLEFAKQRFVVPCSWS